MDATFTTEEIAVLYRFSLLCSAEVSVYMLIQLVRSSPELWDADYAMSIPVLGEWMNSKRVSNIVLGRDGELRALRVKFGIDKTPEA